MLIAEIHNKFMEEDRLTSDFIGISEYLPQDILLLPFLNSAVNCFYPHNRLILKDIKNVELFFWPRLCNGKEPDVIIKMNKNSGKDVLILIECKYRSGKSNVAVEDEETRTGDQIALQIEYLQKNIKDIKQKFGIKDDYEWFHIFLTADDWIPKKSVIESAEELKKINLDSDYCKERMFWTNWQNGYSILLLILSEGSDITHNQRFMITDLKKLLELKGLTTYRGFDYIKYPCLTNDTETIFWEDDWWNYQSPVLSKRIIDNEYMFFKEGVHHELKRD